MANDRDSALFWSDFAVRRGDFVDSELLAEHFRRAEVTWFCPCGCASFEVQLTDCQGLQPLVEAHPSGATGHYAIHSTEYQLDDRRLLSLTLFVDHLGMLQGLDIDINYNSEPVPDREEVVRLLGT
jgi:hypothetical protein